MKNGDKIFQNEDDCHEVVIQLSVILSSGQDDRTNKFINSINSNEENKEYFNHEEEEKPENNFVRSTSNYN